MESPAWLSAAEKRWIEKQEEQKRLANQLTVSGLIADSPETAPGWRDMGMDFQLAEDPAHPRDPAVTKAIQVFDPDLVPLWCRWGFLPPGGGEVVVFGRHAVGRWVSNPKSGPKEAILSLVNQIEFIWEGTIFGQRDPRGSDLPGAYLPWDWRLYSFCKEAFAMSQANLRDILIDKPKERAEQQRKQLEDDFDYRMRDLRKFVDKKLENVSEVEMKEHFLGTPEKPKKVMVS